MYNGHVGHKLHRVGWPEASNFWYFVRDFGPSFGEGCAGVGSGLVGFVEEVVSPIPIKTTPISFISIVGASGGRPYLGRGGRRLDHMDHYMHGRLWDGICSGGRKLGVRKL